MNLEEAAKATRNGAIAACVSAAMSVLVIVIAISTDASGKLALWNDPLNFIDVFLILGCALGMYRKSRAAAILIFVYFIAAKIIIAIETQSYRGLGLSLVFLYFYGMAIRGSFVYHKLRKQQDPEYKATSKWTWIIGVPSILVVVTLIAVALMSTTGVIPATRVHSGSEMTQADTQLLLEKGIISPTDQVDYFYSQGVASILESGNILTQDRVILYLTNDQGNIEFYEIGLAEITEVTLEVKGDSFTDSVYKVSTADPERWLKLFLSVEQKGDQKFVKAIQAKIPGK